jgi:hypothetical protein
VAVIAVVLAQSPASASTASTSTESSPAQSSGSGSPSVPQDPAPQSPALQCGQPAGDQALQPLAVAPSHSYGGSLHTPVGCVVTSVAHDTAATGATEVTRVRFPAIGTTAVLVITDPAVTAAAEVMLRAELAALDRACSRFRVDSEVRELGARCWLPCEGQSSAG